jgi:hypothetical protein
MCIVIDFITSPAVLVIIHFTFAHKVIALVDRALFGVNLGVVKK